MNIRTVATLVALGSLLSGCATIVKGTTQPITVDSQPVRGAQCSVSGEYGAVSLTTPATIEVKRSGHDMVAMCKKDGYQDATQTIPSHFNGATVGNVLLGGIIGVGVDAMTGANYTFPTVTMINLLPVGAPPPPPPPPPPAAKPAGSPAS